MSPTFLFNISISLYMTLASKVMNKQFSKEFLFKVRNSINLEAVISEVLEIHSFTENGIFRFRCSNCRTLSAAVNSKNNLARCFSCCKNFNNIDLVIKEKNINFKSAVDLLVKFQINKNTPTKSNDTMQLVQKLAVSLSHSKERDDTRLACNNLILSSHDY